MQTLRDARTCGSIASNGVTAVKCGCLVLDVFAGKFRKIEKWFFVENNMWC